jgi:2',3'-cyclic-nucleotide 2'-phosphodiesterase (5'-nucleotidase family)
MTEQTAARRGPRLRIVSINDVYALENLPRLATLVAAAETPDLTLVVLAGDFLAPSILSSLDGGRGMVECLNAVGVTHVTFGNHEDDVPLLALQSRVGELHAKWLATNVHGFTPALPSSDVIEVTAPGGRTVKVGLVGVVMDDAAVYRDVPFGGAWIEPPNEAVRRAGRELVEHLGCACVVAVTHQPLDDDRRLAAEGAALRVPVIVGGHEHTVHIEQMGAAWIVKAGMDAQAGAITDLVWPAEAPAAGAPDVPAVSVRLEPVAGYAENAALRTLVDLHMLRVHALEGAALVALGEGESLSSVGARMQPATLGTLVCSRLRDALGAEACVFNGGGIRAARTYTGRFAYGDLKAEVPFDNEVVVVRLPGAVLRDAVAMSRAHAPAESGGYLQVDDRMIVHEPTHVLTAIGGVPLDPERDYRVAMVRNLLEGMDHIAPLVDYARAHPERVPPVGSGRDAKIVLVDAFARVLWKQLGGFDAVDANHDGRVTRTEIADAVARLTHAAPSSVAAELVLQSIDTKHQGEITPDELEGLEDKRGGGG